MPRVLFAMKLLLLHLPMNHPNQPKDSLPTISDLCDPDYPESGAHVQLRANLKSNCCMLQGRVRCCCCPFCTGGTLIWWSASSWPQRQNVLINWSQINVNATPDENLDFPTFGSGEKPHFAVSSHHHRQICPLLSPFCYLGIVIANLEVSLPSSCHQGKVSP